MRDQNEVLAYRDKLTKIINECGVGDIDLEVTLDTLNWVLGQSKLDDFATKTTLEEIRSEN